MSGSSTAEQSFDATVTARALADTLSQWSPGDTISAHALKHASVGAASLHEQKPTATKNLPKITIVHRMEGGPSHAEATNDADFEVVGSLGEGGMGRVLLARQHSLGRDVAIKTVKENDDSAFSSAILHEGRITGTLEHPGIVPVHALGLDDRGLPLLVMKRIEGVSFRALLDDATHPAWQNISMGTTSRLETSVEVLIRVCQSLAFAHNRGIVHRDIKPENILIGDYGEIYLCDWGVAIRIEEASQSADMLVGTLHYMAPEMLLGEPVDARTDVYLLGATLHEILTGRPRHDGSSMQEIFHSIATSAPYVYDATISVELAELCNRATSTDRENRPASADAFRKELAQYLHQRSAMVLCSAAMESLRALEETLETAGSNAVPEDVHRAYRHATEARFGFVQSLRVYPQLNAAERGLERTLVAMFDLEMRQRHVQAAAALLEEMAERPPPLVARLSALREEMEAQQRETERLRAMARDIDPHVGARPRMLIMSAMSASIFVIALFILARMELGELTPRDVVGFAVTVFVAVSLVLLIFRRRLTETLFNRRLAGFFFAWAVMLVVHRLAAWRMNEAVPEILVADANILLAMLLCGSISFERRLASVGVVVALCLGAMMISPENVQQIFQIMTLVLLPLSLWIWRTPRKTNE